MNALLPDSRKKRWRGRPEWSFRTRAPEWEPFDRYIEDFGMANRFEDVQTGPPIDVSETESELVVKVEVPGLEMKDIDISVSHGLLSVKGEKKQEMKDNEICRCSEMAYGRFARSVCLPVDVDAEKVRANVKNGVLTITLPRMESAG